MRRISRGEEATKVVAFLFLFLPLPPPPEASRARKSGRFSASPLLLLLYVLLLSHISVSRGWRRRRRRKRKRRRLNTTAGEGLTSPRQSQTRHLLRHESFPAIFVLEKAPKTSFLHDFTFCFLIVYSRPATTACPRAPSA